MRAVKFFLHPSGFISSHDRPCVQNALAEGKERAWAITPEGRLIGSISLSPESDENRGFWLAPEHWGQGYMGEASDPPRPGQLALGHPARAQQSGQR
jgi:RimJ/RimL family protein N-acetyltransferase